jgi:hypothetical protein
MKLSAALKTLRKALSEDKGPGSYYYVWQSSIACTIMDNSEVKPDKANEIAMKFLDLLIGD